MLILRISGAIRPPPIHLNVVDRGKFTFIFYCMHHYQLAVNDTKMVTFFDVLLRVCIRNV